MRRAKYSAKKVLLRKASTIGYGMHYAKPGNWVTWNEEESGQRTGRVLGRIECAAYEIGLGTEDCKGWLAVMQLSDDATHAYVRWVNPDWVQTCYEQPPAKLLAWITGDDWPKRAADIPRLLAMQHYGTCSEEYIEQRNDPDKPYNKNPEFNAHYVLS
jgi:hypothetical protein